MFVFEFPQTHTHHLKRLLKQLTLLIVFSSFLRGFYLLRNAEYFSQEKFFDLAWSFVIGMRFDLSLLALLMAPLFIFYILPWKRTIREAKLTKIVSHTYLAFIIALIAFPNIADAELLHFTGRRLSLSLLQNSNDFSTIALPLALEYWYLSLPSILLVFWTTRLVMRVQAQASHRQFGIVSTLLGVLFVILALGFTVRGGSQGKPLRPQHSLVYNRSPKAALLSINSTHSLLTTYDSRTLSPVKLLDQNHRELVEALKESQVFGDKVPEFDNVVVLILESIGKEYLKSDTKPESDIPFLESLGDKGLLFENNYANGSISMMAINSVIASIPPLNLGALAYSGYPDTKVNGLPAILKKYGYESAFLPGGPKGVFYFDSMALQAGFDRYIGQEEFKGEPQLKNYWGIDDDSYLQFMAERLDQMKEPFIASCFTLSNHFPYAAPESFTSKDPKHEAPGKYRGARFTDFAVRRFFEKIQHYPWYNRTLFIMTGDHPAHERDPLWEKTLPVNQMVPLIFFHPSKKLGDGRSLRITQHADIVPSVLDFLGVGQQEKQSITPFGHSVFQKNVPGRAFFGYESGDFFLASGSQVTHFDLKTNAMNERNLASQLVRIDPNLESLTPAERDFTIKASLQYFTNGVIDNDLYPLEPENVRTFAKRKVQDNPLMH